MTIISPDDLLSLGTVLFGLAWLGFWIDGHPIGRKLSGVVFVIVAGIVLSNFRVIPYSAPAYDFVGEILVPMAIPLLLFKADMRRIFRESGVVMLTFCIAAVATVAGAVLGFYLLDLGEIGVKVAGVFTGGWIGGAVNFLAVSRAVAMTPDEFSVSLSASSVVSILALLSLVTIPTVRWITSRVPSTTIDGLRADEETELHAAESPNVRLTHLSGALALSLGICACSRLVAQALSLEQYTILLVTLLALLVANSFPKALSGLEGDFEVGMLFMYVFFATAGAGTDAVAFIGSAFVLVIYGLLIVAVHLTIVLLAAKLLRIDLAEAVIGSAAALVGPAPAAAIAISRGWRDLITPGIMCGVFGYAIATFIGVAVTRLLN